MTEQNIDKKEKTEDIKKAESNFSEKDSTANSKNKPDSGDSKKVSSQGQFKKNPRKTQRRQPRVKPEFDSKILSIRRVTRVVSGGRRFSFSVSLVAGNRKGSVGVGMGKASDTSLAIDKAMRDAKKNMVKINLTDKMSLRYDVEGKFNSSRVIISPAPGRGLIAGSSVRNVIELAGIKEINAKILSRSKNKFNNARAAIVALSDLDSLKK